MLIDKIKKLAAAKAKVALLEESIAVELNRELAGLPAQFGFDSAETFAAAVKAAAGTRPKRKTRVVAKKAPGVKRRKRAKITDATRAEVKKLVEAGKTAPEIAKAVRISEPSVANIKKALGLTRKAKK